MKAVTYNTYGGPEVLEVREVAEPKVGPDSVLVRVRASSVNPVDWKIREGYLDGLLDVFFPVITGWDVAGVVEQPGPAVPEFAEGEEVIGYVREDVVRRGTFAQRVAAPVRTLARKPASLTWEQAASLPLAGLTAYQGLVHALRVSDSDTVLIHAASGGVGSFAVQIAAARGARVLGTASQRNHDFLRQLGAEPVEYGDALADRVSELVPDGVTAVLDLVGGDALEATPDVLADGGRIASVADAAGVATLGGRYVFVRPDAADLTALGDLVEAGRLRVPVARTFALEETAAAQKASAEGHTRGKIAVLVD